MNGVQLLQFYDDVSDEEAVERLKYTLRWKVALDLALDYSGFHPTSLTKYRNRLVENNQECYAFDRFIAVAREAGFIPDRVTLLTDTTNVRGAGAVQDTYTLLRKGIPKVLSTAGFHLPNKRQCLAPESRALLERYVDRDRKADIDWLDPQQRLAQLRVLFQDAEAASDLAAELTPALRAHLPGAAPGGASVDEDEVRLGIGCWSRPWVTMWLSMMRAKTKSYKVQPPIG